MNDRLVAWSPLILIALLAALTFWLDRKVQEPAKESRNGQRLDPDFTIEGMSAVRMNPDGTRRYALSARKLAHFPVEDNTQVDAPTLVYYDYKRAPVTVRADTAELIKGGEEVIFQGNVQIIRDAFEDNRELGIFTTDLHVIPEREFAVTDKPVRLVEGDSTATAVGLEFDNKTRQLKLLSQAKATYASPSRKSGNPAAPPVRPRGGR
jgi:lipopolysaccharide export system protein LptC